MLATVCNKTDDKSQPFSNCIVLKYQSAKHNVLLVKLQADCHKIMHMSLKNLEGFFTQNCELYPKQPLLSGPQDISSILHQYEQKPLPKRNSFSNPSGF